MIYDTFLFFNEIDLLELRLQTMGDVVDKFVIVESNLSFRGLEKPLHFADNRERFRQWENKIIHTVVDDMPQVESAWDREQWQREHVQKIINPDNEDLVIIADVDEIVNPVTLARYAKMGRCPVVNLVMKAYYYYFDYRCNHDWIATKVILGSVFKSQPISASRKTPLEYGDHFIGDGGWHFTYMGGKQMVRAKLENFSHWDECEDTLAASESGKSLEHESGRCYSVIIDQSYPPFVYENQALWASLGYIRHQ